MKFIVPMKLGRLYDIPPPVVAALEHVLDAPARCVKVVEHSVYAQAHCGMAATTRRNLILLSGTGDEFFADPEFVLHEYFHVVCQWNTGYLTRSRYLWESLRRGYRANCFETAAREFAAASCERYRAVLSVKSASAGDPYRGLNGHAKQRLEDDSAVFLRQR